MLFFFLGGGGGGLLFEVLMLQYSLWESRLALPG